MTLIIKDVKDLDQLAGFTIVSAKPIPSQNGVAMALEIEAPNEVERYLVMFIPTATAGFNGNILIINSGFTLNVKVVNKE